MEGEKTYRSGCPALLFMDFVAVMLFTRSLHKVFQQEYLILLIIEIIIILNQISAWSYLSKFFIKEHVTFFLSLLKKKKEFCHMKLFLYSSGHWGNIVKKFSSNAWGSEKR